MPTSAKKKRKEFKLIFFISLFVFGVSLISYSIYYRDRQISLSFKEEPNYQITEENTFSIPAFIDIYKVNISIPVVTTNIKDGIWEVSQNHANYLKISAKPGEGGNIVIYGHNKNPIFGNLIDNELLGEKVEITTQNNRKYKYEITEKHIVNPDEISYVEPTDHEELTIYTCTGFLDSKRLVIKALPIH